MPDRQSSSSTPGAPRRNKPDLNSYFTDGLDNPASANALLSTQDFFDLSAAASPGLGLGETPTQPHNGLDGRAEYGIFDTLGPASAPFDQFESLEPDSVMADAGNDLGQNAWDVPFAPGNDVLGNMCVLSETDLSGTQQQEAESQPAVLFQVCFDDSRSNATRDLYAVLGVNMKWLYYLQVVLGPY